ncbi:hypothetical protein [Nocardioides flavescens]|nr:hypothetical protein [Nocardioides flavescens]
MGSITRSITLGRVAGVVIGLLMIVVGVLWTAQGLGWVEGSSMSGSGTWAVLGPLVAGLGLGLVISIVQRARQQRLASELDRERYGQR